MNHNKGERDAQCQMHIPGLCVNMENDSYLHVQVVTLAKQLQQSEDLPCVISVCVLVVQHRRIRQLTVRNK